MTPVYVRFSSKQLEALDRLVAEGVGETHADVVRRAVRDLDDAVQRFQISLEVEQAQREVRQFEPEDVPSKAVEIALARRERWVWTEDGRCIPEREAIDEGIPIGKCLPRPSAA